MTGPEHYRQAEHELAASHEMDDLDIAARHQRQAQVHATLALAAATADPFGAGWTEATR